MHPSYSGVLRPHTRYLVRDLTPPTATHDHASTHNHTGEINHDGGHGGQSGHGSGSDSYGSGVDAGSRATARTFFGRELDVGMVVPPRSLVVGVPAKIVREVTDEQVAAIRRSADGYVAKVQQYL